MSLRKAAIQVGGKPRAGGKPDHIDKSLTGATEGR